MSLEHQSLFQANLQSKLKLRTNLNLLVFSAGELFSNLSALFVFNFSGVYWTHTAFCICMLVSVYFSIWDILRYEHFSLKIFFIYIIYGSENWTLTASQTRRIEGEEMKLLRPLAGYILYDHKTKNSLRRELQTECILEKIDEYRRNWFLHLQKCDQSESLWNHITTDHKEGERLEDRRNIGEHSCNSGDGTDQRFQFLMFMMMMIYHSFNLICC